VLNFLLTLFTPVDSASAWFIINPYGAIPEDSILHLDDLMIVDEEQTL
jgi:hypothetical protein